MNRFISQSFKNDSGQSILEFLLMLPMMISFIVVLTHINQAIQMSIVNQQYARAQTTFRNFNSAFYPSLNIVRNDLAGFGNQAMYGVAENPAPRGNEGYRPMAPIQLIPRSQKITGPDDPREEPPTQRAKVRVRNTITMCTPSYYMVSKSKVVPFLTLNESNKPAGIHQLSDGSAQSFSYCGGLEKYEQ